jgi:hypothetical protein
MKGILRVLRVVLLITAREARDQDGVPALPLSSRVRSSLPVFGAQFSQHQGIAVLRLSWKRGYESI